jgi:hypothetical protein
MSLNPYNTSTTTIIRYIVLTDSVLLILIIINFIYADCHPKGY